MNTTKVAKPIINDNVSNIVIVFTSVRIEGGATSSNYLSQQYSTLHSSLQTIVHFLFVHTIFLPGQLWPGLFFCIFGTSVFCLQILFQEFEFLFLLCTLLAQKSRENFCRPKIGCCCFDRCCHDDHSFVFALLPYTY